MGLQDITRKDLEKKLEEVINVLTKKGLIPALSAEAKKDLIKNVSEKLINDKDISLTKEDLKNDKMQNALGVACMAELLPKDRQFDYSMLFKPELKIDSQDLQKQLTLLLTNVLKLQPQYQNKSEAEKIAMEGQVKIMALEIANSKQLKDTQEPLAKNESLMNVMTAGLDLLSDHRRQLYGVDTQNPGEEPIPVLAIPIGDQMGFQDLAASGQNFMAERDNPNSGQPDPNSMRILAAFRLLADGQTSKFEQYLMDNNIIPSNEPKPASPTPFSMKPDPHH